MKHESDGANLSSMSSTWNSGTVRQSITELTLCRGRVTVKNILIISTEPDGDTLMLWWGEKHYSCVLDISLLLSFSYSRGNSIMLPWNHGNYISFVFWLVQAFPWAFTREWSTKVWGAEEWTLKCKFHLLWNLHIFKHTFICIYCSFMIIKVCFCYICLPQNSRH